jgi:hypothetical protein
MFKHKAISFLIKKKDNINKLGTPENSIILPFLFNIYMSKLDIYLENFIKLNQKGIWKTNPEWTKITYIKNNKFIPIKERHEINKNLKQQALKKGIKRKIKIKQAEKLYYIRYNDEFILGYNGNKKNFKQILINIQNFIKSSLQLNTLGFNIKSAFSDKTPFLGFQLKVSLIKKDLQENNT